MPTPLIPAGPTPAALDGFLQAILRSRLLTQEQLDETLRGTPADRQTSPEALADSLVKSGKLSRFQARKLLQGAARGLLLGPYQILAPIGKGGMGTVFLTRDSRNQMLLALKVLPPKRARTEDRLLARFRREMELCRRVGHAHLAWTYDAGVMEGVNYIAMEFIPGKSLYRLVSEQGPLAVSRAARLFAEAALGLEHAHQQGLIHRDLKPSNIIITPNDHAKVLDLGLALMQGEAIGDRRVMGGQGYVVGTMDYIAPEQTEDASRVDPRSDIYSLGCTLYFALTGRVPFPGGKAMDKIRRHRSEEPTPLVQLNPQVPAAFAALVNRMMAKRPEERFGSAAELRAALHPWIASEPVLPMDEAGDQSYQTATAAIATAEVWTEDLPLEELPLAIPVLPRPPRGRVSLRTVLHSIRRPSSTPGEAWWLFLFPLVLGLLLILGLFLMILLIAGRL